MSDDERAMIATTNYGKVKGASAQEGVYVFRGVPYASPPVGAERWRPAKPPKPWSGVLNATSFMPRCPQPPTGGLAAQIMNIEADSEDCLYCNIWTPGIDDKKRPVAVWIHGGGFLMGSGSWPDGVTFARDGIVVVSLNYRLGAFGFLYLDDLFDGLVGTGNLGLSDQIAALRWVQENITAFGGDPSNVTIFGESAGAISIGALLGSPAATGLFQRAILQSGASHHARSTAGATLVARRFCEIIGVEPGDNEALYRTTAEQLKNATTQMMLSEMQHVAHLLIDEDPLGTDFLLSPVIDGRFLEQRPIDAIRKGSAAGIDLLTGINEDEWRLVIFGMGAEIAKTLPPPDLERMKAGTGISGADLLAGYKNLLPNKGLQDLYSDILSDLIFKVPAYRLADAQAAHARVYYYLFRWPTPVMNGILGACHALEIPFVFDQLKETPVLFEGAAPQSLADMMHRAWIAFISKGQPVAPDLPEWPPYDAAQRATMCFDETPEVVFNPDRQRLAFWPHW